jgi:hypothetical protein
LAGTTDAETHGDGAAPAAASEATPNDAPAENGVDASASDAPAENGAGAATTEPLAADGADAPAGAEPQT